jgi:CelD/BcsL family acetyltransferase involved in cellulose biosynthesis
MTVASSGPAPQSRLQSAARGTIPSGRELRCEVITDFGQLELWSSEWQRLWESDCRGEVFQTPGWAKAWWRAFGERCTLCTLAVYEEDELVGIVPLVKRAGVVQFLGTPQADYADIICEERRATDVLTAALDALVNRVGEWNECDFQHLAKHSRVARHYHELPRRLRRCLHVVPTENYRTIVLRENREGIFKELLGKQHTRRRQNKLQKAGQVQFRFLETKAEAEQYLIEFFRHHVRRMAVIGKKSTCARAEFCSFLRALVGELDLRDGLRFAVLELDGRALAWAFGFEANGKFLLYQHTFDVDAWDYTPGEVLLWKLLEYAKGNLPREFDFGSGAEAYKKRFTNYQRETCRVFFQRPGFVGRTRGLIRQAQGRSRLAGSHLKQAIQEHKPALTAFRSFRSMTAEILHRARKPEENQGLLTHVFGLSAHLLPRALTKPTLEVFVQGESSGEHSAEVRRNEEVSIKVGSFGDLVDLARERWGLLTLRDLPICRQRLKRGDRVYLVLENCQVVLLSWVTVISSRDSLRDKRACSNVDGAPMFLDECTASSHRESPVWYRELLSLVSHEAASRKSRLMVSCRKNQHLLRSELLRQGFLLRN